MLDDAAPARIRLDWLPPEAPLPMPVQVIERRRPRRRAWLRRLLRAAR